MGGLELQKEDIFRCYTLYYMCYKFCIYILFESIFIEIIGNHRYYILVVPESL